MPSSPTPASYTRKTGAVMAFLTFISGTNYPPWQIDMMDSELTSDQWIERLNVVIKWRLIVVQWKSFLFSHINTTNLKMKTYVFYKFHRNNYTNWNRNAIIGINLKSVGAIVRTMIENHSNSPGLKFMRFNCFCVTL